MGRNIEKEEAVKNIMEILDKRITSDRTIVRLISHAEKSVMEASELDIRFMHGTDGRKKSILFSDSYAKLMYAFIALRYEFDTFEVVSRSWDDEFIHKTSKEKNSDPKSVETMNALDNYEVMRFMKAFDEYYLYVSEEEQKVLKYFLQKYGIEDVLRRYEKVEEFLYETACYLYYVCENYDSSIENSITDMALHLKHENVRIVNSQSQKTENSDEECTAKEFGNIYEKIYKAVSDSIKYLFEQSLTSSDENSETNEIKYPGEDMKTNRQNRFFESPDYKRPIASINIPVMDNDEVIDIYEWKGNSVDDRNFTEAQDNFNSLLYLHFDMQVMYQSGDFTGMKISPDEAQEKYYLTEPLEFTQAYRECYKNLVIFSEKIEHDSIFIKFVDTFLDDMTEMIEVLGKDENIDWTGKKLKSYREMYISNVWNSFSNLYSMYHKCSEKYEKNREENKTKIKEISSSMYESNQLINKLLTRILMKEK